MQFSIFFFLKMVIVKYTILLKIHVINWLNVYACSWYKKCLLFIQNLKLNVLINFNKFWRNTDIILIKNCTIFRMIYSQNALSILPEMIIQRKLVNVDFFA